MSIVVSLVGYETVIKMITYQIESRRASRSPDHFRDTRQYHH